MATPNELKKIFSDLENKGVNLSTSEVIVDKNLSTKSSGLTAFFNTFISNKFLNLDPKTPFKKIQEKHKTGIKIIIVADNNFIGIWRNEN